MKYEFDFCRLTYLRTFVILPKGDTNVFARARVSGKSSSNSKFERRGQGRAWLMQFLIAQLLRVSEESARLAVLNQHSASASERAMSESLEALARSRDLLAKTSQLVAD